MEGDKAYYNGLLRYHLNINKTLQGMARFCMPETARLSLSEAEKAYVVALCFYYMGKG